MQFIIEITDTAKLAGITAARDAYNAGKPEEERIADDAAYVQWVMDRAAEGYAAQFGDTDAGRLARAQTRIAELEAANTTLAEEKRLLDAQV